MNFSIHLADDLVREVSQIAKKTSKTRNALITQAVREFVAVQGHKNWPQEVYQLAGVSPNLKSFESHRDELKPPTEINLK